MLTSFRDKLKRLKREIHALVLALRDSRTPWYAKVFLGIAVAYALSPVDLIPDVIPVLGYLDELVLLPLALTLAVKLVPTEVMAACRERADDTTRYRPSRIAAAVIVTLWLVVAVSLIVWIYHWYWR